MGLKNVVEVFPNPAVDKLTFQIHEKASSIEITDLLGKNISKDVTIGNHVDQYNSIDVSQLPSGTYFIRFVFSNEIVIKKFVKE
jgi:nickel-dependent lactate racemase